MNTFRMRNSWLPRLLVSYLLVTAWTVPAQDHADQDFGFAFDQFPLVLQPGWRTEIAGPFYYREHQESLRLWAVPPLLSYAEDPPTETSEFTALYPVLTYVRAGEQYRWHLFQLFSFAGGPTQKENDRRRFTLYPIYFQQRSSVPEENYTAVVPFYGTLKNRLFRDEIDFVLFPAYSKTRKRDVVTRNYLFPIVHLREGDGLEGWQVWPFYGEEHKLVTTRTDGFGDVELIGGRHRFFVLWPIFVDVHEGLGTGNPQHQQMLLPAYSYLRSPQRDATTVVWPFFTYIDDRERGYREWQMPWPFIDFARGPGKTINRVWPIYSHAYSSNLTSSSLLWPVYRYNRVHSSTIDRQRTRVLFFLYSNTSESDLAKQRSRRRVDLLPLFSYRRDFEGSTRFQLFALLEPVLPGNSNVERAYSPVWSVWRSERNATNGHASQSLLWNLYRRETTPESRKTSALFGLFKQESGPEGKSTRFLFLRFR